MYKKGMATLSHNLSEILYCTGWNLVLNNGFDGLGLHRSDDSMACFGPALSLLLWPGLCCAVWLQHTSLSLCTIDTKTNQLNLYIITKMTKHVTQSRVKIWFYYISFSFLLHLRKIFHLERLFLSLFVFCLKMGTCEHWSLCSSLNADTMYLLSLRLSQC